MSRTSFNVVLISSKNKVDLFHVNTAGVFVVAKLMQKVIEA